jgi:hypothetical protein
MIAVRMSGEGGAVCVMLVLEPGNIEKLKRGEPIHKFLNEFMPELKQPVELLLAYSPDIEWVAEQFGVDSDALRLAEILAESLKRPQVMRRGKAAEDLKPRG